MTATQAGLSPQLGAELATANYLIGALAAILTPALARSQWALRLSLLVLAAWLALMPATHAGSAWLGPLAVAPFLRSGYHQALLISVVVVVLAAMAAGAPRRRFRHHLGPLPSRVRPAPKSGADRRCPAS